jgi:hypothetical protein
MSKKKTIAHSPILEFSPNNKADETIHSKRKVVINFLDSIRHNNDLFQFFVTEAKSHGIFKQREDQKGILFNHKYYNNFIKDQNKRNYKDGLGKLNYFEPYEEFDRTDREKNVKFYMDNIDIENIDAIDFSNKRNRPGGQESKRTKKKKDKKPEIKITSDLNLFNEKKEANEEWDQQRMLPKIETGKIGVRNPSHSMHHSVDMNPKFMLPNAALEQMRGAKYQPISQVKADNPLLSLQVRQKNLALGSPGKQESSLPQSLPSSTQNTLKGKKQIAGSKSPPPPNPFGSLGLSKFAQGPQNPQSLPNTNPIPKANLLAPLPYQPQTQPPTHAQGQSVGRNVSRFHMEKKRSKGHGHNLNQSYDAALHANKKQFPQGKGNRRTSHVNDDDATTSVHDRSSNKSRASNSKYSKINQVFLSIFKK